MSNTEIKNKVRSDLISMEQTVHLKKELYNVIRKDHARRAVDAVRDTAKRTMGTSDVRIDPEVDKYLWKKGKRHVPTRIRVRMERKMNTDEKSDEKLFTVVTFVPVASFKGLKTKVLN